MHKCTFLQLQRSGHSDPKIYISQHATVIELNQHPNLSKKPQGPASLNEKLHPFEASTNAAEISCRCFSILAMVKLVPKRQCDGTASEVVGIYFLMRSCFERVQVHATQILLQQGRILQCCELFTGPVHWDLLSMQPCV